MMLLTCARVSHWLLAIGLLAASGAVAHAETAGDSNVDGGAPALPSPRSLLSLPAPRQSPPPDEYKLRRATDGSGDLIYEASGFYANVARDGAVRFRDRHVTNLKFFPFLPVAGARPGVPSLEDVVRSLRGRRRGDPNAAPSAPPASDPIANETLSPSTTFSRFRPDPREICRYPNPCFADAPVTLLTVTGTLDITDELMRMAHEDPYRFQKARFLTATREMRIRMAGRAHAEDVARSRADLPRRLEEIACDDGLSVADRRAVIEALRAELDVATPEGRAQAEHIRLFLESWRPGDGGASSCPGR